MAEKSDSHIKDGNPYEQLREDENSSFKSAPHRR